MFAYIAHQPGDVLGDEPADGAAGVDADHDLAPRVEAPVREIQDLLSERIVAPLSREPLSHRGGRPAARRPRRYASDVSGLWKLSDLTMRGCRLVSVPPAQRAIRIRAVPCDYLT